LTSQTQPFTHTSSLLSLEKTLRNCGKSKFEHFTSSTLKYIATMEHSRESLYQIATAGFALKKTLSQRHGAQYHWCSTGERQCYVQAVQSLKDAVDVMKKLIMHSTSVSSECGGTDGREELAHMAMQRLAQQV
jgi:hypothetical protein